MPAGLPRLYWIVWVGTLVNRAGGFVVPLLTFYLTRERGLSLGEAGAIVSLYGAGAVAAGLVGGVLADHLGRRATMAISLLGGAVLMLALGTARAPLAIAIVTPLCGFVSELYRPAVAAFVADVVPVERRLAAYGHLYWAINVGFSIAPLAAGLVAGWSYRALFIGDAATTAIYGVIVLAKLPETKPAHVAHDRPPVRLSDILRDRTFMIFCFLFFVLGTIAYQSTSTLSGWMSAQDHGERTFGAVIAVNGIVIVLLQPVITRWVAHHDARRVLAVAALLTGAGMALHGTSSLVAVHVIAVIIWTLGEIASAPTSSALVAALAPPEARGRYQGVFGMTGGGATFVGPLVGPLALAHGGPLAAWGGCLVLGALTAVGFLVTARRARI